MVADLPPVSGRPAAAPGLAPLPPQRRLGSSSRGLKFDPLFMGPGDLSLVPAAAPSHGGMLPTDTGDRYGKFAAKPEPLEWPPSGDLKAGGEVFPIGVGNHHHYHHHHQQQQQVQQQRYQPFPSLGQQYSYGGRPVRSAFFSGVGVIGGGGGGASGGASSDGMFDNRLTPTGASYLGHLRQPPLGQFAPDFSNPPPLPQASAAAVESRGQGQEVYPERQPCLIDDDDDDQLEAEALAAVGANDMPSVGTAAPSLGALADNMASLEEISATIRAGDAGQEAGGVGGGPPGDDLDRDVDDRDEGAEGNGPLRSCCSFLALNEQDNIVGDADSWQEGKNDGRAAATDDDDDDGGGALLID